MSIPVDQPERFKLMHGPYHPPPVGVGDWVECEVRGAVQVRKWSQGPSAWPLAVRPGAKPGAPAYVLCGDLVRAIQVESEISVAY